MISDDVIQKVKEQNDIIDIISETVKLKRSGKYYLGLCPFHHEKTPSFTVTPDKQIYKCFGCGEAGNVITFVMKTKNLPFAEAVETLAKRANIEVVYDDQKSNEKNEINKKLYKINVEAARYFFNNLRANKNAMIYFKNRGIDERTLKKFGLGYAIDSWNNLLKHLKHRGYTELDMLSAGLIIKSDKGKFYDRFRNRVIFPVFDYRGRVIGFGGRVLDDSKPKYLNSPETAVFKKGTNLYGLNFAIKHDMAHRTLLIVEGYMDCISLHQYGIYNVVASLGTALTTKQAKLLKRYADNIIISYDADLAGQSATLRGLEILKHEGFDVKVLEIAEGKDPDEFIKHKGKEAFLKLIDNSMPLIDYKLKRAEDGLNILDSQDMVIFIKKALEIIKDLDSIEKDVYIKKLCEHTNVKDQVLYDLLNNEFQKNVKNSEDMNIHNIIGHKLYLEPAFLKAERGILRVMMSKKESLEYVLNSIKENELILDEHKKIFRLIVENKELEEEKLKKYIEIKCNDANSIKEWVNICNMSIFDTNYDYKSLIIDFIKEIRKFKLEESKKNIMNTIKDYEAQGKIKESLRLGQELINIQKELRGIQ